MPRFTRLALSLLLLTSAPAALAAAPLTTQAERSGFIQTGRYDEVIALCDAFAQRYPQAVRCIQFGTTPEGRPMKALIASTSGALDAQSAAQRKLPVVLVQGGIHAGEIDGKDAGFLALRELLDGKAGHGVLDKLVWVFVPVFNVDGHERFGAWNRPNQRGPEQMGWRTTAQNLNLNRDYVKADAPEMQAMLQLVQQWDPLMYVDLHVTDGAKFEHDVSVQVEPAHAGDASLQRDGTRWRDAVLADLKRQGSLPLPYYPSFVHEDDPSSGFADDVSPPRFSHGYFLLRNRFGMLVETHSWKDYPTRVRITRNAIVSVLQQAARHGTQWRADALAADQRATRLAGTTEPLSFAAGPDARTVAFRGYAYTHTPSPISGALMTRYDESKPQVWKVPLRDQIKPDVVVDAPRGGYLVPAAQAALVGEKLRLHGIQFTTIGNAAQRPVQTFRADAVKFAARSNESHQTVELSGQWRDESRDVPAGSLFVPIAQSKARLVMAILEPQAPDSLLQWGFFNTAFERKEYMEAYVAEDVARDMLANDAALKAQFEQRIASDPDFSNNPQARLEFFAKRHASWDERYQLYPILRTAQTDF
ncbi:M14 family metallopeptidase [Xanthomonas phaseoli]|uniref:Peptidase M14 n=1 Tax=Xanthomonas phaseoli pv. dieffenbachiae TaxID=92828 RepID=A0A1V9H3E5_9XANT|nr:M14 family metallopeptidase [Xanthomonas phaseoli]MBO9788331.1 M14 family metallopeptidase [Xanthomonas phaseoli pv. dieffenbachiae]MBO9886057.1 M14 family metallopeptidase [Xanthomonas phaseoli pv. dieffenbachiae]MBO9915718.1 M14 family metallopeptidase [Xanthomonas phaseoli pv. dieffenbachiae]MBO9938130.1 M14 family metallopeptidase [Xanthomonas phaseoli pv. dieffenbachiae]MBO9994451.1 M14 family metallopeptidase [Xanthomonas phaseoli pv. dieffenbachiae]